MRGREPFYGISAERGAALQHKDGSGVSRRERFDAVPFFWTTQYDFTLNYVGHAETWDKLDLDGSIEEHNCKLSFRRGGNTLAVATIGRDRESLESELAMERAVQAG